MLHKPEWRFSNHGVRTATGDAIQVPNLRHTLHVLTGLSMQAPSGRHSAGGWSLFPLNVVVLGQKVYQTWARPHPGTDTHPAHPRADPHHIGLGRQWGAHVISGG